MEDLSTLQWIAVLMIVACQSIMATLLVIVNNKVLKVQKATFDECRIVYEGSISTLALQNRQLIGTVLAAKTETPLAAAAAIRNLTQTTNPLEVLGDVRGEAAKKKEEFDGVQIFPNLS